MNLTQKYPIIKQFIRFAMIGVINTGVDLLVLNFLMFVFDKSEGIHYSLFKAISFSVAVISSYFLNKYWAFEDSGKKQEMRKISQFIAVSIIGALINVGTATLVVEFIKPQMINVLSLTNQLWGNIGALCGTAIGLIWNFVSFTWNFAKLLFHPNDFGAYLPCRRRA